MTLVRAAGIAALALFALSAFTPLPVVLYALLVPAADQGRADAIVVMAASGVLEDGLLADDSLRRAAFAVDLYRVGRAPLLVLSGSAGSSESTVRAALAAQCGVPAGAIIARPTGYTTHEEVDALVPVLRARGVQRVLLVTDGAHIRRSMRLFRHARFDVLAAPVRAMQLPRRPGERLRLFHETAREGAALLYYSLAGYR